MGKITVKRFFNKKLKTKPIMVYDDLEDLGYPLYYSITYNRKTQHIKSLCGAVMTEKAFNHLEQTNEPLYYETNYLPTEYTVRLKDELFLITKATEIIINSEDYENILDPEFIPRLKEYFEDLRNALYFQGWLKYMQNADLKPKPRKGNRVPKAYTIADLEKIKPKQKEIDFENAFIGLVDEKDVYYFAQQFYYCFNQKNNLLYNLSVLEKILKIDLTKYIYIDTLKFWQVIHLMELTHEGALLIQFVTDFDPKKYIELNKKMKYSLTDNEIILISKKLKNRVLNISFFED